MTKERISIPNALKEKVLKEYNHRCAVCGTDRPQLHHIDEDPSNNDPFNLIPLCPNCHLIDHHNPTFPVDAGKLKLFREYKDPAILKPQFHPLYLRFQFLYHAEFDPQSVKPRTELQELVDFIEALEMGAFYSKKIKNIVPIRRVAGGVATEEGLRAARIAKEESDERNRQEFVIHRKEFVDLIIELLRYQKWT